MVMNPLYFISLYEIFGKWQSTGVFDLFLPALLVFAIVYGILTATNILGSNRGVAVIISLCIAILVIQSPMVSNFFQTIFPALGIGLSILLVVLVMVGIFIGNEDRRSWYGMLGMGALVIGIIIAIAVVNEYSWFGSIWWQDNYTIVLFLLIVFFALSAAFKSPQAQQNQTQTYSLTPHRS